MIFRNRVVCFVSGVTLLVFAYAPLNDLPTWFPSYQTFFAGVMLERAFREGR